MAQVLRGFVVAYSHWQQACQGREGTQGKLQGDGLPCLHPCQQQDVSYADNRQDEHRGLGVQQGDRLPGDMCLAKLVCIQS